MDKNLLNAGVILCAIMVAVLFFRLKTRGKSAYVMATAFAVMAFLLYGIEKSWTALWLNGLGVLLGILLVLDFLIRLIEQNKKP